MIDAGPNRRRIYAPGKSSFVSVLLTLTSSADHLAIFLARETIGQSGQLLPRRRTVLLVCHASRIWIGCV